MIQRIQSVFLLFVALCMTATIFFPLWQKQAPDSEEVAQLGALYLEVQKAGETTVQVGTFYIAGLAFVAICLAFASLFSYKNRMLQMKINLFNTVVMAGTLGLAVFFVNEGNALVGGPEDGADFGIGFFLPVVALVLNALANRFIQRDERLVRDADRLR